MMTRSSGCSLPFNLSHRDGNRHGFFAEGLRQIGLHRHRSGLQQPIQQVVIFVSEKRHRSLTRRVIAKAAAHVEEAVDFTAVCQYQSWVLGGDLTY